jgi:hypothetical protein
VSKTFLELFNALCVTLGITAATPKVTIQPEPVVLLRKIPKPPPKVENRGHQPPPSFGKQWGFARYRLGNWKTRAEAREAEVGLRMELQTRDLAARFYMEGRVLKRALSPWGVHLVVIPDLGSTFSLVLYDITPYQGAEFCPWLTHDSWPYGVNPDGTPWSAWPAWTRRGRGRTCERITRSEF